MKQKTKKAQVWLVMTGFSCNNNCVVCSTKPKAKLFPDRESEEITADLRRGRNLGYDEVDITGGEPTIRPDIFYLVKMAKDLGYRKIGINTNARMLSYQDFCQRLIKEGVNRVTFTLNGHTAHLVNVISRTPNIFNQTMEGIKNVAEYPEVELAANTVVSRINYRYLKAIGKIVADLKISSWHLLDLIPDGYGKEFYKELVVKVGDLSQEIKNIYPVIKNNFNSVMFFDFSPCLFPPGMLDDPHLVFITAQGRIEITKQVGYNPARFRKSKRGLVDNHKKRLKVCRHCRFSQTCAGVWTDYLKIYGGEAVEKLAQKHNCLVYDKKSKSFR